MLVEGAAIRFILWGTLHGVALALHKLWMAVVPGPIAVPASDTATTLGAALLAGVGVGFYKDYDEAVSLTVKEIRRHEPNPENKAIYDQTYQIYLELYKSLAHMMAGKK